jgi:hypothetical protein
MIYGKIGSLKRGGAMMERPVVRTREARQEKQRWENWILSEAQTQHARRVLKRKLSKDAGAGKGWVRELAHGYFLFARDGGRGIGTVYELLKSGVVVRRYYSWIGG